MLDEQAAGDTHAVLKLLDAGLDSLEELDDVQKVFSNADFSDRALSEYGGSAAQKELLTDPGSCRRP